MAQRVIKTASITNRGRINLNENMSTLFSFKDGLPGTVQITYADSATTDGIEASLQVLDNTGAALAGVRALEVWISDSSDGTVLTSTAASGALTAATGTILNALTAKKHVLALTDSTGLLELLLVDSANTEDEYFCVKNPATGAVIVGPATVATDYEGGA
jgi:hypothetical protein